MMAVSLVCEAIKALEPKIPKARNTTKFMIVSSIPVLAAASDLSYFFSPSDLDNNELIPTPVPDARAIIRFCIGNASVTAVRAFSLILATKMLSTTL